MNRRACRWCRKKIRPNKTGLCQDCFNEYRSMLADLKHMEEHEKYGDDYKRIKYEQQKKDKCACGKLKIKKSEKCLDCDRQRRSEQGKRVGKSNKGRRYYFSLAI